MSTLSGFKRPADPINSTGLATYIYTATGLSVNAEITPTDVLVTGVITESDRTAIQNAISQYAFPTPINAAGLADSPDMSQARHTMAVSEYAAYTSDMKINAKQRGAYINGVFTNGVTPYILTAVTNGAGQAIVNVTDDMTANGKAIFSTIPAGGVTATPRGAGSTYQVTSIAISANMKTVTVSVNQLGTVAAGLINVVAAAAGVAVDVIVWGS